jgi:histidine triad (HIT) family protein
LNFLRLAVNMASIFSRIVSGEIPSYKIAENDRFLAFLDVFPLVEGHTLVIPKKEVDLIWDMEDDVLADLHIFAKQVALKVKKSVPCRRVGMTVIGIEVPHAHIHLIPMDSVSDMDFSRPKIHVPAERMEAIAESIRKA